MKYTRLLSHLGLVAILLFLPLMPGKGSRAGDVPPERLGRPVSVERETTLTPAYTGCGGVSGVPSSNEAYEQEVVALVNQERASRGLPPFKRVSSLDEAARYHTTDMGQDNYFDHDSYDRSGGTLTRTCSWSQRVQSYYTNWSWLAENIAGGYTTPESVMAGWMGSTGHRNNILSTNTWEIGVGYYQGSGYYGRYWVQDFGRRSSVYPLIINREAAETDSRQVSLYLYGDWDEVRLRNDDDNWTAWQTFQNTMNWTLGGGAGDHTVWAEMRSGGQTTTSSDTIYLTRGAVLGNLPDTLGFTYSMAEERLLSSAHQLTPQNVGDDDTLTWGIAAEGTWFTFAPTGGTTPSSFWITPTTFNTSTVGTYTGAVTVTVTDPSDTVESPHRIELTLNLVNTPFLYAHLPLILRNYTPPPPPALYPNDPYYASEWALDKINAPSAWAYTTGPGVLIAVLDSGTDLDHPDLASKIRTDIDWDFVNNDDSADDDHDHGTHVAGTAAAATNNSIGVAGLGWESTILPLKVLNAAGNGVDSDLSAAIRYAADNGADVVNMSLGGAVSCPSTVQSAVDYAYARGVILIAAAGNNLGETQVFPANCTHVLGVGATTSIDTRPSFSNYGNHVSIAAPGSNIYSTLRGGSYGYGDGTSMATPHVAGLAALLRARYPSYTPDQIASAILDNAVDLDAAGWDKYTGCGRIDAFESLRVGAHGSSPACLQGVGPWGAGAETADAPFAPGEVIVSFRAGVQAEQAATRYGESAELLPALNVWRLHVPPGQEQALLARLQADPAVDYAELNYLVSAQ